MERRISDEDILSWGNSCDLDSCEQALTIASEMGGDRQPFCWLDFTNGYDWDEDGYYQRFFKWWVGLKPTIRRYIYAIIHSGIDVRTIS